MPNLENFMNTIIIFLFFPAYSGTWLLTKATPAQGEDRVTRDKVTHFAEQLQNRNYFTARSHHEEDIFYFSHSKGRHCRLRRSTQYKSWRSFGDWINPCLFVSNFLITQQFWCHLHYYRKKTPGRGKSSARLGLSDITFWDSRSPPSAGTTAAREDKGLRVEESTEGKPHCNNVGLPN